MSHLLLGVVNLLLIIGLLHNDIHSLYLRNQETRLIFCRPLRARLLRYKKTTLVDGRHEPISCQEGKEF